MTVFSHVTLTIEVQVQGGRAWSCHLIIYLGTLIFMLNTTLSYASFTQVSF